MRNHSSQNQSAATVHASAWPLAHPTDVLLVEFQHIFFTAPFTADLTTRNARITQLVTHDFYVRIQLHYLSRFGGASQHDAFFLLRDAQSRLAEALTERPTLGLKMPDDNHLLPGFVRNYCRNIARQVIRANRPSGGFGGNEWMIPAPDDAVAEVERRDFLEGFRRHCRVVLAVDEDLVASFRWFMGWTIADTSAALGLTPAIVKTREARARAKIAAWVGSGLNLEC